ncbi:hypothetical protein, partial [Salmonella sp. s51944]|uniref:hypothetical protein n=1 Tax=Salmonella sp. s51944 TaxID=3159655 RepID=UPI00398133A6
ENLNIPEKIGQDEERQDKMDPRTVQELADALNEFDAGVPTEEESDERQNEGPEVTEEGLDPSEQAPPPQTEEKRLVLTVDDEKELQELWDMDWPQQGEPPISSNMATSVESAPPAVHGSLEESAPTPQQSQFVESAPAADSQQPGDGGALMINFNPAAGEGQRGFNMTAEAEKELQERWQQDTQPSDQSKAPKPEEDDGPQVQENMT